MRQLALCGKATPNVYENNSDHLSASMFRDDEGLFVHDVISHVVRCLDRGRGRHSMTITLMNT
ncbi:hypothetical protein BLOT_006433 [Blomia tropicalis]|nr:hypothetical protein BLOT_006433 [Blomia tropicalis]